MKYIPTPNCSDLVAVIPTDSVDYIGMLKLLSKITGWTIGISSWGDKQGPSFYIAIPISRGKLKIREANDETGSPVYVDIDDIPAKYRDKVAQTISATLYKGKLPVGLIPYKRPIIRETGLIGALDLDTKCGYCGAGPLVRASQHCYTPHFKPLAKIVRFLNAEYHSEDGGTTEDFVHWCSKHRYTDIISES